MAAEYRRLRFPQDRSLGILKIYSSEGGRTVDVGEAQGLVTVPRLADLTLILENGPDTELSPLGGLAPDDLFCTIAGSIEFDPDQLSFLAALTGLKELHIEYAALRSNSLEFVRKLVGLQGLSLIECDIRDAALRNLKHLAELTTLNLMANPITDMGFESVSGHSRLEWLNIGYTQISDLGMRWLKRLPNLKDLYLDGTSVTDKGLEELYGLRSLQRVRYSSTVITESGITRLKEQIVKRGGQMRPSATVLWGGPGWYTIQLDDGSDQIVEQIFAEDRDDAFEEARRNSWPDPKWLEEPDDW